MTVTSQWQKKKSILHVHQRFQKLFTTKHTHMRESDLSDKYTHAHDIMLDDFMLLYDVFMVLYDVFMVYIWEDEYRWDPMDALVRL